jgi:hypothetical protein
MIAVFGSPKSADKIPGWTSKQPFSWQLRITAARACRLWSRARKSISMESPFRITPKVEESELPPLKRGIGESPIFDERNVLNVDRLSRTPGDGRETQYKQVSCYPVPLLNIQITVTNIRSCESLCKWRLLNFSLSEKDSVLKLTSYRQQDRLSTAQHLILQERCRNGLSHYMFPGIVLRA